MSDQPETPEPEATPQSPAPSAGTQNTSSADDNRIPYQRFKEVNEQNKALQARLEELEAAEQKRKQAAMSEAEKAQAAAEEARNKAAALEAQLETERQARLTDRRKNVVANALTLAQAIDPEETVDWLSKHAVDDLALVLKDDGSADPDQIKKLVDLAKADRPHHFRPGGPGSPSNRGGELPAANLDAEAARNAEFLRRYGFEPDEKRLAAFTNLDRDRRETGQS